MTAHSFGNNLRFDQTGTGPALLFLHDTPEKQEALFRDCSALTASNLRVIVALLPSDGNGRSGVMALLKQLGIGRAVIVAIGKANHTLVDLLEQHPGRIAAASFVADRSLAKELRKRTHDPRIRALLRSGRRNSVAQAVAKAQRPSSPYGAVREWAGRIVGSCRAGIRNCSAKLAGLELPGLIQFDDGGDDEQIVSDIL